MALSMTLCLNSVQTETTAAVRRRSQVAADFCLENFFYRTLLSHRHCISISIEIGQVL